MKKCLSAALVFGAAYFGIVPSSYAACNTISCDGVLVSRLFLNASGDILIDTSGDERDLFCTPASDKYIYLTKAHMNKREIYATLLTAQLAKKKVSIRISDGAGPCQVSYVLSDDQ